MKIIEIRENQKEEWNKFIAFNNSESFLQSWEWGEFQQVTGKKIYRIGIKAEDGLMAIALLIKHDLLLGKSYLYCPRGPIIANSVRYSVSSINDLLLDEVEKIAKKEKSLFLRVDPPIKSGNKYLNNFKKNSFEVQPKDTLILNLERSEEDLLKEMKPKTRYNIRLAEKKGVEIGSYESETMNQEEFQKKLDFFWTLIEETSERNKIISHNKNYYQKMLENLCFEKGVSLSAKLYLAEYEEKIIAANIVLCFGNIEVYLHGASSNEHRNLMAPYLLQWRQIQDAKNAGCKKYDFWGITIDGEKESWQGITKFKKGFGGEEKSYIGAYDVVIDKKLYWIYLVLRKIRNLGK